MAESSYSEISPQWDPLTRMGFSISDATSLKSNGQLGNGKKALFFSQVHGCHGAEVVEGSEKQEGDFIWTRQKRLAIGVFVADCTAVLMSGQTKDAAFVAAIHAGWRGTAKGILGAALDQIQPSGQVKAWMSPSICKQNYEVSKEVVDELKAKPQFLEPTRQGHYLLDLKAMQKEILEARGVEVWDYPLCTFEQQELFSYRQMKGKLEARHFAWIELF